MHLKKYLFFIFCLFFILNAYSQNEKSVIPPSPISTEFEKYINYNVSLYNGVPDINIPLYTIKLKGLDIPVSLSYHASGIKFWQQNGEVGLGWVLNPGYRISRTIYGQPDEKYPMISTWSDSLSYYSDGLQKDKFLAKFLDKDAGPNFPRPDDILEHLDGEYDLYSYTLPTTNGNFVITDRNAKTIQTIDESNIKVDYSSGAAINDPVNGFLKFDVKDEQGNTYYFGQHSSNDINVFETPPNNSYLPTAWALTNLTTTVGDQLNFKYTYANMGGWNASSRSTTITETEKYGYDPNYPSPVDVTTSDWSEEGYRTFLIQEINSSKESIKITRGAQNLITQLAVYSSPNVLTKSIQFFYSQGINNFHQFLDSIQIKDNTLNPIQTYRFTYNYKDNSSSYAFADQWGYYKMGGYYIQNSYHQEFMDDQIQTGQFATNPVSFYMADAAARSSNDAAPIWFSLSTIKYPTGGTTTYEYESNRFLTNSLVPKDGGGLRIKSISSIDGISDKILTRTYKYGEGENSYGKAQMNVDESFFEDEKFVFGPDHWGINFYPRRIINYSNYMQGDVSATGFTHSFVTYPEVTEYYSEGKVVHKYNVGTEYEIGPLERHLGYYMTTQYQGAPYVYGYRYWDKPTLAEETYYSANNLPLKKDVYTYDQQIHYLQGLKVKPFITVTSYNDYTANYSCYPIMNSFFKYSGYTITYGKKFLTNKTETIYDANNKVDVSTDYTYKANTLFLATEITANSKGEPIKTLYDYPSDFPLIEPYQTMITKNILTPVIQKTIQKNGSFLSAFKTTYKDWGNNILLPETEETKILSNPYEVRVRYKNYDNKGNLLEQQKENDISISYLWGYNGLYPVAEVKGSNNATISGFINQSILDNPASDQALRDELDKIRTNFALVGTKALVSTFTFKPLIGMTSQTDANGKTTYYEYDAFGRVILIRDKEWNILKKFCYTYAGQTENCSGQ